MVDTENITVTYADIFNLMADLRAMADPADNELTAVVLKLTGGSGLQEIDEIV